MSVPRPRGRDLARAELEALAAAVAARPDLWARHVRHDAAERTYAQVLRDEHVDVWLICWSRDHDTGFHDHDVSAGAVAVVEGAVREERLLLGQGTAERTVGAGGSFGFDAADIHRVLHAGEAPAVTIHAYSPPLARMGAYAVEEGGELRRYAIAASEELRPLEGARG